MYELQVDGGDHHLRKVMNGSFHGAKAFRDGYLLTEDERGVVHVDDSYRILQEVPLPVGCRPHGLAVSESTMEVFVVGSHSECVYVLDGNLNKKRTLCFSNQNLRFGAAAHHVNDVCMSEDRLLVSMFSISGHWRIGNYDGGVAEIDSNTGDLVGVLVDNLQLPHSVSIVDTELFVLDSLNGMILKGVNHVVSQIPAFLRGLVVGTNHYVIGGSRNRNLRQNLNSVRPVSIDSCIYVLSKDAAIYRTISLDNRIPEIHCVVEMRSK
jgi:DNA-binding beta-propeller fold protein YncE